MVRNTDYTSIRSALQKKRTAMSKTYLTKKASRITERRIFLAEEGEQPASREISIKAVCSWISKERGRSL